MVAFSEAIGILFALSTLTQSSLLSVMKSVSGLVDPFLKNDNNSELYIKTLTGKVIPWLLKVKR